MIQGLDVSRYQGYIDWQKVKKSGKHFAFIMASQGSGFHDETFQRNWSEAEKHGLYRAAYHYLVSDVPAQQQLTWFHNYVHSCGGFKAGDAVLVDVEDNETTTGHVAFTTMLDFIQLARKQIDKQVILYTNQNMWSFMGQPYQKELQTVPLCVAQWDVSSPQRLVNLPSPAFWQYTSAGRCPGISGDVDLDQFLGDMKGLHTIMNVFSTK